MTAMAEAVVNLSAITHTPSGMQPGRFRNQDEA